MPKHFYSFELSLLCKKSFSPLNAIFIYFNIIANRLYLEMVKKNIEINLNNLKQNNVSNRNLKKK